MGDLDGSMAFLPPIRAAHTCMSHEYKATRAPRQLFIASPCGGRTRLIFTKPRALVVCENSTLTSAWPASPPVVSWCHSGDTARTLGLDPGIRSPWCGLGQLVA